MECVSIKLKTKATREQVLAAWSEFAPLRGQGLPSAPEQPVSEKYMIVIECRDEEAQRELLTRFLAEGLDCKALCA